MRRRPAPGTESDSPTVLELAQRIPAAETTGKVVASAAANAPFVQEGMAELQQKFQALLQDQMDIGHEERAEMAQFFEQSIRDAAQSPTTPLNEEVFDKATWSRTVDLMRKAGTVTDDEADHLVRTINDALLPLERRESRLAIEFNRRMAADGEQKAVEWLQAQSMETQAETARRPLGTSLGDASSPARDETINSRSRRLRGPPR